MKKKIKVPSAKTRKTAGALASEKAGNPEAYDAGRIAHDAGISVAANPWPVFDHKYQQWTFGWMDAHHGRPAPAAGA